MEMDNIVLQKMMEAFKLQEEIIELLTRKLAEAEAVRDQAVKDLETNSKCQICAHRPDGDIEKCPDYHSCGLAHTHWEWRGVKDAAIKPDSTALSMLQKTKAVIADVEKLIDSVPAAEPSVRQDVIEVPCSCGTLCAQAGGDPDYPEVFVYLRRPDGVEIDITAVCGDGIIPEGTDPQDFDGQTKFSGGLEAYLYGDTSSEEWTRCHGYTRGELEIEC